MEHIKVVIGANFGDEGKGMMANYFSSKSPSNVLNILYNGGVQRGHTVNGHVFHCFGSSTFNGSDTYYDKNFIVNPIGIVQESEDIGYRSIYTHPDCRVTTPYDMIINQTLEDMRGNGRHGSCGLGIYETILRHKYFPIFVEDLFDPTKIYNKIKDIRDKYVPIRLKEIGIKNIPNVSIEPFMIASEIISNSVLNLSDLETLSKKYNTLIFEGGQGLLLSEGNHEYFPHLTPSYTGSEYISEFINRSNVDTEVCYVTRSYMTRHGAGKFNTECNKNQINPGIVDKTNIPNEYQKELRFGFFDYNLTKSMVIKDLENYKIPIISSMSITHLNYTNGMLCCRYGDLSPYEIDYVNKLYLFDKEVF